MGKKAIVIDTNVLVSAFLGRRKKPAPYLVLERVVNGEFELILSQKQITELRRIVNYPKFKFTDEQKAIFLDFFRNLAIAGRAKIVEVHKDLDIIKDDAPDNMFLEAALENNASYIISGDSHLLKLKEVEGIKILTPSQFLSL